MARASIHGPDRRLNIYKHTPHTHRDAPYYVCALYVFAPQRQRWALWRWAYVASPAAGPGSGPLRGVSWCLHARVLMQERACIVRGKKMEVDKRKKYVRWLSNQNAVSF